MLSLFTNPRVTSSLTKDTVFHLLSNSRRRAVIVLLAEEGSLTIRKLSEKISDKEGIERKNVYISIYQCHIPKLEKHDVVRKDRDTIELGDNADELLEICEIVS